MQLGLLFLHEQADLVLSFSRSLFCFPQIELPEVFILLQQLLKSLSVKVKAANILLERLHKEPATQTLLMQVLFKSLLNSVRFLLQAIKVLLDLASEVLQRIERLVCFVLELLRQVLIHLRDCQDSFLLLTNHRVKPVRILRFNHLSK